MLQERAIAPVRGTSPKEGRRPVHPHRVDGEEIEPSVSEPMLKATHPAAVAEAGPADEPLDPCLVFQGLRVTPPNHTSPCATVASSSIIWLANPAAPHVVRMPFVASKSLAPHGNPCRGPRYFPAAISRSASLACARARSSASVTTNFSAGSYFFSRSRYISVSATEETFLVRTSSPKWRALANAKSSRFFGAPGAPILGALEMRAGFRSVSNFIPGNTGLKISAGSTELGMCSL